MLILVATIVIVGAGWWYFSNKSACEDKIIYVPPSENSFSGKSGGYYQICSTSLSSPSAFSKMRGSSDGCTKYESREAAMNACLY